MGNAPTGFVDAPVVMKDHEVSRAPCLGLLVNGDTGETIRIPRGATMFVITDPQHVTGVTPLVLLKVTNKQLVFHCGCGIPSCTRIITYAASRKGTHPQRETRAAP